MTDLYLIRHAESEMNLEGHLIGGRSNNTPLSTTGKAQAKMLGERLKSEKVQFNEIYSSPAVRAKDTAYITADIVGFDCGKIMFSDALQELNQGEWTGKKRDEIYTPEQIVEINAKQPFFKPPNGESQYELGRRVYDCLEQLASKTNATIGVFTHGVAIKCFLREILSSSPNMTYKINIDNTSITQVKYTKTGWHILRVNDAAHIR